MNCYHHIKEITLYKFIIAHCDKDLSVLRLSGRPTEQELTEAWENLYKQYVKAIGGNQFSTRFKEVTRYNTLRDKVSRAIHCLQLSKYVNARETLCNVLNTFKFPIPKATPENIDTVLQQFDGFVKLEITKLNQMTKKLEGQTKKEGSEDPKEEDYYNTIFDISEGLKVPFIKPKEITVAEYCTYVNKYRQHVERIIKEHEKAKH